MTKQLGVSVFSLFSTFSHVKESVDDTCEIFRPVGRTKREASRQVTAASGKDCQDSLSPIAVPQLVETADSIQEREAGRAHAFRLDSVGRTEVVYCTDGPRINPTIVHNDPPLLPPG